MNMDPDAENSDNNSDDNSKDEISQVESTAANGKKNVARRRTKTGCLTCRKRRIKCDEERPVCKNCIKSKRECAGYNHPLVYRPQGLAQGRQTPVQPSSTSFGYGQGLTQGSGVPFLPSHSSQPFNPQNGSFSVRSDGRPRFTLTTVPIVDSRSLPLMGEIPNSLITPVSAGVQNLDMESVFSENRVHAVRLSRDGANSIRETPPGQMRKLSIAATDSASRTDFVHESTFASDPESQTHNTYQPEIAPFIADSAHYPDNAWHQEMYTTLNGSTAKSPQPQLQFELHRTSLGSMEKPQSQSVIPRTQSTETSPLLEEKSRKIFAHFITVTAPCMGIFDRSDGLDNAGTPNTIWTHSLPTLAFSSPALAHAILAVGAMHMFKRDIGGENTAVKHFTFALKRVTKLLDDLEQRLTVSTLATILLLAYYEVMAGDHSRWNLHLSGAVTLIMEHNHISMAKVVGLMRTRLSPNSAQAWLQSRAILGHSRLLTKMSFGQIFTGVGWEVDKSLISQLTGKDIDYDKQTDTEPDSSCIIADVDPSSAEELSLLVDLYWWYCKQDVFMSLLSGDPLLLPYSQWKYCPPRGPLNNPEESHSTVDHLWLLLARLAEFGSKDRVRKQRVVSAQGGHWIPAPGFMDNLPSQSQSKLPLQATQRPPAVNPFEHIKPVPPSANEGRSRQAKLPQRQPPPLQPSFYGLLPPASGPIHMSGSFNVMNEKLQIRSTTSLANVEFRCTESLDVELQEALDEHASIEQAFDLFESSLGPEYQPLINTETQIATPFGPALQYKTLVIATMWTYFYVGRILLCRFHPHSPPAAIVSAGVNAVKTQGLAQTIGRICGGMVARQGYASYTGHTEHVLVSAMIESTLSLLFAAVQYHDTEQRAWTISRLRGVAHLTGWQTSVAVAAACEATWEKAGMAGRGPPYQRITDQNSADIRLNGRLQELSKEVTPDPNMSMAEEHESRFV